VTLPCADDLRIGAGAAPARVDPSAGGVRLADRGRISSDDRQSAAPAPEVGAGFKHVRPEHEPHRAMAPPGRATGPGLVPRGPQRYVQTLVEAGIPGLLIALWAAVAALGTVRRDPWLLDAVAAVLMHAFVDFDLQIPAIPVLLVCLVAMRSEPAAG